jgi:hypothetical protein
MALTAATNLDTDDVTGSERLKYQKCKAAEPLSAFPIVKQGKDKGELGEGPSACSRLGCRFVLKTRDECFGFYIRASFNHVESSSPAPGSSTLASHDGQEAVGPTPNSPTETTNYTMSFSQ